MNIVEGINLAFSIKRHELGTDEDYKSFVKSFVTYLKLKGEEHCPLEEFSKRQAVEFLDYVLQTKEVAAITRNNYSRALRALFYVLVEREYITENPFARIKMLKEAKKRRVTYTKDELLIIFNFLSKTDKGLLCAVYLTYFCAVRGTEMRRLRVSDFDLNKGMLSLSGDDTKNKDIAWITIPNRLQEFLEQDLNLKSYPRHYYMFGKDLLPAEMGCSKNRIRVRYREAKQKLEQVGILSNMENKTLYSHKDTAMKHMLEQGIDIITIMKHFRHKDLSTTQRYAESFGIFKQDIRGFDPF